MTHITRDNPPPRPPTSRDGIESWLDVLTSMLSLPPSQRTQVRDELGETAQLARHISSANRTPKSFRRFAMNATFFVLAGSILTASVSMMMPTNNISPVTEQIEASVQSEVEHNQEPITAALEINDAKLGEATHAIADAFAVSIELAPEAMQYFNGSTSTLNLRGSFTLRQALDSVLITSLYGQARPYTINGNKVFFGDTQPTIASPTEIRTYTLDWSNEETATNVFETLYQVVGNGKFNSSSFTARFIANLLVVETTVESHKQIEQILADAKIAYEELLKRESIQQQSALERIRAEFDAAKRQYLAKSNEASRLELRGRQFQRQADQAEPGSEQHDRAQEELADLAGALQVLHLETQEQERRYESLQSLMLDAERDSLMNDLN